MGIFSGSKEKSELVLVFDIGSSSVGGALFRTQKSGLPKIIFAVREPIALEKNIIPERFLISTLKSLETVVNKVYVAGMGAPKKIFCVLSSPWHVSQTRVIKLEKNASFPFTSKLANTLIKKEMALFEEENFKKYVDFKSPVRSIELKNIKTMLNGYEIQKPLDQKTKELEMTIFVSASPEQVLKKMEKVVRGHFNFEEIKFSSFAMASFAVMRDLYTNQEDFLLIDVGGEVTDIAMVKKNILHGSNSFPLGRNFVIRGVASALSYSLDEAESFISLFRDGHATKLVTKKLEPVMDKLKAEWLQKFQDSLANLSSDISIPSIIYVAADKDLAGFFYKAIEAEQFNQYTLTESKFKVILLGTEVFHGLAQFEENIVRDSFLIIDSIYINRFLKI